MTQPSERTSRPYCLRNTDLKATYFLLLVFLAPVFAIYIAVCLLSPLIRFGSTRNKKGKTVHITRDLIHSDYLFSSKEFPEFSTSKKYTKVGWGDRKIFLETRTWGELKVEDFLRAFFGLNKTVLRVDFLDEVPPGAKRVEMGIDQMEIIKFHIRRSFRGSPIERRAEDYQGGVFYESDLNYNCVTNCNNWVNKGLWLAGVTNRIWRPLSFH